MAPHGALPVPHVRPELLVLVLGSPDRIAALSESPTCACANGIIP
jgi:hypothetical protein